MFLKYQTLRSIMHIVRANIEKDLLIDVIARVFGDYEATGSKPTAYSKGIGYGGSSQAAECTDGLQLLVDHLEGGFFDSSTLNLQKNLFYLEFSQN